MTGLCPPLRKNDLKYLQIEDNPRVLKEALSVWREAHELIAVEKKHMVLTIQDFFRGFHPHAAQSQAICALMEGAQQVCLLMATLGADLESHSRRYLEEKETFRGYLLDRMGSYLVEKEMRKLDAEITEACRRVGKTTTKRYSPGYRDFSMEAQKVFFDLFGSMIPGLSMLPGFLLKPEKTITAVKGVLPGEAQGEL